MSPAEIRFRVIVVILVARGVYPGPAAIRKALGTHETCGSSLQHSLNGRECRWREDVLVRNGWTWTGERPRSWQPPESWTERVV